VAGNPDDFIPDRDCVDGDCTGATQLFTVITGFKPAPMSTNVLMAGRQPTAVKQEG
jgi:hypothetical protein